MFVRLQRAAQKHQINVELALSGVKDILMRDSFETIDTDGDGLVTHDDLFAAVCEGDCNVELVRAMIDLNDSDQDGKIAYDDFVRFLAADPGFGPWHFLRE